MINDFFNNPQKILLPPPPHVNSIGVSDNLFLTKFKYEIFIVEIRKLDLLNKANNSNKYKLVVLEHHLFFYVNG